MLPTLKVYNIDYEFIIKNYLSQHLWQKIWTLLQYKEHIITLNLYKIMTKDNEIVFEVKYQGFWGTEYVNYNIANTSIKILKQQINGAMFRIIERYEESLIEASEGYKRIEDSKWEERMMLKSIASDFLDREGVTNDEIREVYIDRYVDKNETIYDQLSSYKRVSKYTILTDLFLIFCEITLDKTRIKTIIDANGEHTMRLTLIESEVKEFSERLNTTDYIEEMECELEGL